MKRTKTRIVTQGAIVLGFLFLMLLFFSGSSLAQEAKKPVKILKAYPGYWYYGDTEKDWYLRGLGTDKVKQPDLEVLDVLTKDNVDRYKDLLPPTLYETCKTYGLVLNLIKTEHNYKPSQGYIEATKKNTNVTFDSKQWLANYHCGQPFSKPKTGLEVMWNYTCRYIGDTSFCLYNGSIYDAKGRHRDIGGRATVLMMSTRTDIPPTPEIQPNYEIFRKEMDEIVYPAEIRGTNLLFHRYRTAQPDDCWMYVPTMRRIRRYSVAQRWDSFAGSHSTYEAYWVFNGKPQDYEWTLVKKADYLLSLHQRVWCPQRKTDYTSWGDPRIKTSAGPTCVNEPDVLMPQKPNGTYQEILGSVANLTVEQRPFYVVDGKSRDPNCPCSKMVLWIDEETSQALYGEYFDRRGNLYKTAHFPYDVQSEQVPGTGSLQKLAVAYYQDMLKSEGDWWEFSAPDRQNQTVDPTYLTQDGLIRLGR